jgi:hypothetical protein
VREGFFGFGLRCCGLYVVLVGLHWLAGEEEKSVGVSSLKEVSCRCGGKNWAGCSAGLRGGRVWRLGAFFVLL